MKKLLIAIMMLLPMMANADAVEINGIYYKLISKVKTAEVTNAPNGYDGEVVIPNKVIYDGEEYIVRAIGDYAFMNCVSLSSVSLPESILSIGNGAFQDCSGLKGVCLPEGLSSIGSYAFNMCTGLQTVNIPSTVVSIHKMAFANTFSLLNVYIDNLLAWINIDFEDHSSNPLNQNLINRKDKEIVVLYLNGEIINDIVIPNGIEKIKKYTFYGLCQTIESIVMSNTIHEIQDSAFEGCNVGLIMFPKFLSSIGRFSFSGISCLEIELPHSLQSINEYAFYNCKDLKKISLSKELKKIDKRAFAGNEELEDVYCYTSNPTYAMDIFEGSYVEGATLHVPEALLGEFSTLPVWKDFNRIIPLSQYKLTYLVDGEVYKTYDIEEGNSITLEPVPTKEGHTFSGWGEMPETMPTHDVTVTGTFTINRYKLIYTIDGKEYKSYEVEYGTTITSEPEPTKEGYTFSGWCEIPETMPAHDVTITGSFTINKYKLIYIIDGEEYKSYEVDYEAIITPETAPTKEGYTFSGWSEIPKTMPAHDVIVTGTLSINSYKLTYMIDDIVYKETMYEYGATIIPEPQPEGDYATFEWTDLPQIMPARDVVVYASYTSSIGDLLMAKQQNVRIYSPNGRRLNVLQKGVNIICTNDGRTKKVIVK